MEEPQQLALQSGMGEAIDIARHPLQRDAATIPTKALEEFVNVIRDWMDARITGGVIWGNQRVGKTQAIRYLMANGQSLFGTSMPMSLFSAWDPTHTSLSERRFFGAVLEALGYADSTGGTAEVRRKRLIGLIADRVKSSGDYRFVLFIDEAQWLARVQLRYLMDLHNQLKISDIRLVCILVGQPELVDIHSSLRAEKQNHLLGRFMSASHQFKGVCSQSDFNRIATAFDRQSEYPANSGTSYTAFYVPIGFEHGWRLAAHAATIWTTLDRVLEVEKLPKCHEYPMQALMALLVWLLQTLRTEDCENVAMEVGMIEEGIYRYTLSQIEDHIAQTA